MLGGHNHSQQLTLAGKRDVFVWSRKLSLINANPLSVITQSLLKL